MVSDFRLTPVSPPQPSDDLNADHRPWSELGDPRSAGDSIVQNQHAIGSLVDPWRGHAGRRGTKAGDLALELEGVRPLA
jgi:hypothetical protein